jgi:tRNA(Ile)-lysidine synthase
VKRVSVLHQFLDTVEQYRLVEPGERVLIGVSGGADSICLLDLFRVVAKRWRLELFAVHINHQLRQTAERDERFVKDLLESWGVNLSVVKVDVTNYAYRHKLGIEEAARALRYQRYYRVAKQLKCNRVALGHNADDNLETVILNLIRGAGLRGLSGIPLRRDIFIRPLLRVRRDAIRNYLRAREINWVEDETNEDVRFRRNMVRQEVIPVLKRINPAVVENVARGAAIIAAEDMFLDFLATRVLEKVSRGVARRVIIDNQEFNSYNNVLKRRMIKVLLPQIDADATERLIFLIERNKGGRHQLTQGVEVEIKKGVTTVPVFRQRTFDAD